MKKVITAAFAITLVLLSAAFVANCSYSSNTPTTTHNNTPPPPDSLKSNIPKHSPQRITTPKEIWKDETQYALSMLDDTTGLSKDNQFMLVKELNNKQTGILTKGYSQVYKGIEVYAGGVGLSFKQDSLDSKTEHLYKVSLDVNPTITEAEALAKLQANEATPVKGKVLQMKEGLIIKDAGSPFGKDEMHLCWIFHFSEYLVYVDAHSGQIVDCFSTTRY